MLKVIRNIILVFLIVVSMGPSDTIYIFEFKDIKLSVPIYSSFIPYATFFAGEYDFLSPNNSDILIDAGANIGDYTVKVAHKVNGVIAIEPSVSSLNFLQKNLNSLKNVHIVQKALGNRVGTIGFGGEGVSAGVDENSKNVVEIDTLDSICNKTGMFPTLLKMDIEGFEAEALNGFTTYLPGIRRAVIEIHDEANRIGCESILRQYGFKFRYQKKLTVLYKTIINIMSNPIAFLKYDKLNGFFATKVMLKFPITGKSNIPSCGEAPGMYLMEAWK